MLRLLSRKTVPTIPSHLRSALPEKKNHSFWSSELLWPGYTALLSAFTLLIYIVYNSTLVQSLLARLFPSRKTFSEDESDTDMPVSHGNGIIADIKAHIASKGGPVIFFYKTLRLAGCLVLVGLTIATLVADENERSSDILDILKKKKRKGKNMPVSDAFTHDEWYQIVLCLTYVC